MMEAAPKHPLSGDYVLSKTSIFSRAFAVFHGEQQVGTIARSNWFSRAATIDLPKEWPVPAQVFVFWLALLIWRREEAAS